LVLPCVTYVDGPRNLWTWGPALGGEHKSWVVLQTSSPCMRHLEGIEAAQRRWSVCHLRRLCHWPFCLFAVVLELGGPTPASAKQVEIATIGDFLTLGEESSSGSSLGSAGRSTGYPAVLAARLGAEAKIFNYGIPKATMRGGGIVSYSNSVQNLKAMHSFPDVVLIMLGTNDARVGYWDRREFLKGAETLIRDFHDLANRPFVAVLQPPPIYKDGASMDQHVVNDLLGSAIPQAVAASGGGVVFSKGVFNALGGTSMSCKKCFFASGHINDGCHPTDYGYQRMAEAVYSLLIGKGILTGLARAATERATLPTSTTEKRSTFPNPMTTKSTSTKPIKVATPAHSEDPDFDALIRPLPLTDVLKDHVIKDVPSYLEAADPKTANTGSVCPLDVNCTRACCTAPGYSCIKLSNWWWRCKQEDECDNYMATTGCGWTEQFSCPDEPAGSEGKSSDDGTIGYRCCCMRGLWKDGISLQTPQPTPPPTPPPGHSNLPPFPWRSDNRGPPSPSPGVAKSGSPSPAAGGVTPSPPSPIPIPGLSFPLPQGVPQSLANKLAQKAKGELGGEEMAELHAGQQAVPFGQRNPAQADQRQGRQDRSEVAQEKKLEPSSKKSEQSALQRFCSYVANYAVPIGSGLLPCIAGGFLIYQALKKNGFIRVPQNDAADFDHRSPRSKRSRSDRRY